ncbi:GTPase activating protein, putative [Trypanosoma equiperdum]|uniref:GTPase activating protein, putative n=4 Tax=Trypanozoon TaxID=39700 RepID=Q38A99_TRYB2|nr:GTPase activating protein, putative [Trypanosoma brucei brucei TREU927]EAN78271.1 GTPase activating protein, putative [Trypanosoma brucei brucei TREU927]RHW69183.1 GTPase activating protein [Trypanosoma brucei equiperdum]SCU71318.1 GTPase activating protein, putative [Trypanosoma equiperdum]
MVGSRTIPTSTLGRNLRETEGAETDRFGFFISSEEKAMEEEFLRVHPEKLSVRERWSKALLRWDGCAHMKKKKLCRVGVPQSQRKTVWPLLLMTYGWQLEKYGDYHLLMSQQPRDAAMFEIIERDLGRTFPTHRLFNKPGSTGQMGLRSILRAYANLNPETGYVQGMGFLVGTLLIQIGDEESTFSAFVSIMENPRYSMAKLYAPGFPLLFVRLHQLQKLLGRHCKKLLKRLMEYGIELSTFAANWYLTLFAYHFNFGLLSRIWDMFLCEGWKIIHRVAIALLLLHKSALDRARDGAELLIALNTAHEGKDEVEVIRKALSVKFKTADLVRWERKFCQQL